MPNFHVLPLAASKLRLGALRRVFVHAFPNVLEATIIPLLLFFLFYNFFGIWPALFSALVWDYSCLALRLFFKKRIPGMLLLGTIMLSLRTLIAMLSGSVFWSFFQPSLLAVATAGLIYATAKSKKPLVSRILEDVLPVSPEELECSLAKDAVKKLSHIWAVEHLFNAAFSTFLLVTQPLGVFIVASKASGWILGFIAVTLSVVAVKKTAPKLLLNSVSFNDKTKSSAGSYEKSQSVLEKDAATLKSVFIPRARFKADVSIDSKAPLR